MNLHYFLAKIEIIVKVLTIINLTVKSFLMSWVVSRAEYSTQSSVRACLIYGIPLCRLSYPILLLYFMQRNRPHSLSLCNIIFISNQERIFDAFAVHKFLKPNFWLCKSFTGLLLDFLKSLLLLPIHTLSRIKAILSFRKNSH